MHVIPQDLREAVEELFDLNVAECHRHGWIEFDRNPLVCDPPGLIITPAGMEILERRPGVVIEAIV